MRHNTLVRTAFFMLVMLLTAACQLVIVPPPVPGRPPSLIKEFRSTSGRTVIQYYSYASSTCGTGSNCNFRGSLMAPAGFDQVEVFLSGFTLEAKSKADKVVRVAAQVQKFRYDQTTGELEMGVGGQFSTASGQPNAYEVTFVVILTDATAAKFTHVGNGCIGIAQCHITKSLSGAVPPNMQYIGLGTRIFDLGSDSGPLLVNTLAAHIDSLSVTPPNVQVDYVCSLQDAALSNRMFCEWDALVIAFDPAEMEQNNSKLFPQYTFIGHNVTDAQRWLNQSKPPSGAAIAGFLDAFDGVLFFYDLGQEYPIWLIESSATNFATSGAPPDTALTYYGLLLGTTFGDRTHAQTYTFQESRAVGLLK